MKTHLPAAILFLLSLPRTLLAEPEAKPYTFSLFADTYYAYDLNDLETRERSYTTQALYDDEPNLNLAYGDVTLQSDDWRGRLAAQWGSSVRSNYAAEPDRFWRYIQEANLGHQIAPDLWLNGGIFLSHIGPESWISRDNITYLRSLISEYSPYYQTGANLSYKFSEKLSGQLHLLRGWQNISDARGIDFGTQLSYQATDALTLVHNTFLGYEQGTRIFNDFIAKYKMSESVQLIGAFDLGHQNRPSDDVWWHGWSVMGQYKPFEKVAFGGRVERFSDPHAVVASTIAGGDFAMTGFSANIDVELMQKLIWRTEYRTLFSSNDIFPKSSGFSDNTQVIVTSLAVTL